MRQEPAFYPSTGSRDAAPGPLFHSGEMRFAATDDSPGSGLVTYPDATAWHAAYDGAGNPVEVVDANGRRVAQRFDAAGRLTARQVLPGLGVVGPTREAYAWPTPGTAFSDKEMRDCIAAGLGRLVTDDYSFSERDLDQLLLKLADDFAPL